MKMPRIKVEVVGHPPWRHWGFTCVQHKTDIGVGFQEMLKHLKREHGLGTVQARKHLDSLRLKAGKRV